MTDLQAVMREALYRPTWDGWWGITLTMKQVVDRQRLDEMTGSQNFRHFINVLTKKVYGNTGKRFGKRIEVIPVIERSTAGRFHYHIAMKIPDEIDVDRFECLVKDSWTKTRFGYRETHIDREIDSGWIDYITKQKNWNDIDWTNYKAG
jgi:hypothetical protein